MCHEARSKIRLGCADLSYEEDIIDDKAGREVCSQAEALRQGSDGLLQPESESHDLSGRGYLFRALANGDV